MDIGKPERIIELPKPEPQRIPVPDWPAPNEEPIEAPDIFTPKRKDVEVDG